jgi:hypothetical protein
MDQSDEQFILELNQFQTTTQLHPFTTFVDDFFSISFKCCHGDVPIVNHYTMGCTCPQTHTFRDSHVIIYSLNTISLLLHKNDVFSYYNLKTTHIFFFNETHFNTLMSNNTSLNIDTTHSMIIYDNFT